MRDFVQASQDSGEPVWGFEVELELTATEPQLEVFRQEAYKFVSPGICMGMFARQPDSILESFTLTSFHTIAESAALEAWLGANPLVKRITQEKIEVTEHDE